MNYCKYCYRILEDNCEVCSTCGKAQVGIKRQKKFLGIIPVYKDKDLQKAKEIFYHAESAYILAKKATSILEFTSFWDILIKDIAELRTYQDLILPDKFDEFSTILDASNEFQWRLRDAAERVAKNAISDIKSEYRNNIDYRVQIFANDINYAINLADPTTSNFILALIHEVANVAKIEVPNNKQNFFMHPRERFSQYDGIEAELLTIDLMDGHDFERWCASLLEKAGFSNVEVTQGSGDHGVDVLAEKDGIRYAVQCKCYSKDLGNSPIQEVSAGKMMPQYHCQVGAVMTNRYFTKGAQELAAATGTLLWDRDWIIKQLTQQGMFKSVLSTQVSPPKGFEHDDLFAEAVDIIMETGQASVSMIQRRLKLEYSRAAKILDEVEEAGFVGPFQGSKPRAILITITDWNNLRTQYK